MNIVLITGTLAGNITVTPHVLVLMSISNSIPKSLTMTKKGNLLSVKEPGIQQIQWKPEITGWIWKI